MKLWLTVGAVAVCVLSAGVGAGAALLFTEPGERGPAGERGPEGPEGPRGPEGFAEEPLEEVEGWEVDELYEVADAHEARIEELDGDLGNVESILPEICSEIGAYC